MSDGWLRRNSQLVPIVLCAAGIAANLVANVGTEMRVTWLLTVSTLAHGFAIGYLHRDWRKQAPP